MFLFLSLHFIFFNAAKIILFYAETLWLSLNENVLRHVMMYGDKKFDNRMKMRTLTATIKFAKDSKRFDQPLF